MRQWLCAAVLPVAFLFAQVQAADQCQVLAKSYLNNQFLAKGCDIGWQTEGEAHESRYDNAWFSASNIDLYCTTSTDDCHFGHNTSTHIISARCEGDVVTQITVQSNDASTVTVTPAYDDGLRKKHGSYTISSPHYKPSMCHGDFVINPNW